jgi:hypothetical protein
VGRKRLVNFKQTFYQQNVPDGTSEKEKTRLKNFNAFALHNCILTS